METIAHYVNGQLTTGSGADTLPVTNPATGEVIRSMVLGTAADADVAVEAAFSASGEWAATSLSRRQTILFRFRQLVLDHAAELAGLITSEHGKVLSDAAGEIQRGLEIVEMACGISEHLKGGYSAEVSTAIDVHSFRQPVGVVVGITPFNFPVMVPLWMSPIAIATGNTFVLKPSERDPSPSLLLAKLWTEAGLPNGVFNVVQGARDVVNRLLEHPKVNAVSFVGSTAVARHIHATATANGKRVQALGGAKNHAVVMPDADLDYVSDHLVAAAYGSAGERCMAISVAVAVGDVADAMIDHVSRKAQAIVVGDGAVKGTEMGPLITAESKTRITSALAAAENSGATVALDGRSLVVEGRENGFFLGPTIVDGVTRDQDVYCTELFGPVLAVVRVETLDDAIAMINDSPYGNGAAIFTSSGSAARRFEREVHAGMIGINVPIPVPVAHYSFGGWKDSLFGESHIYGPEGVAFYTRAKVVTSRWPEPAHSPRASLDFPSTK